MDKPCTLEFTRAFYEPGRKVLDKAKEDYVDCVDFVYRGDCAGMKSNMMFRMQNGRADKVCDNLGDRCPKKDSVRTKDRGDFEMPEEVPISKRAMEENP